MERYDTTKHETDTNKIILIDHHNKHARDVRFINAHVYGRRMIRPELIDGLYISNKSRDDCNFCEILAVGELCGKKRKLTSSEKLAPDMLEWCGYDLKVGDTVLAPEMHQYAVKHGLGASEYILHECGLQAKIDGDDIIPLGNRVLVEFYPKKDYEEEGVTVSQWRVQELMMGKVESIGKGWLSREGCGIKFPCKPGDEVLFHQNDGVSLRTATKRYRLLKIDEMRKRGEIEAKKLSGTSGLEPERCVDRTPIK